MTPIWGSLGSTYKGLKPRLLDQTPDYYGEFRLYL